MLVYELELVMIAAASTSLLSMFLTEEQLQPPVAPSGAYAILSSF